MMVSNDFKYLRARAAEERERALAATDATLGRTHSDFARQYEAAAAKVSFDIQVQGSRDAIRRSLDLLAETGAILPD